MTRTKGIIMVAVAMSVVLTVVCGCNEKETIMKPQVAMLTSKGRMVVELEPALSPVTVANFIQYVQSGHYNGLVFHRVIPGFMIQGGGFDADLNQRKNNPPIVNEGRNGLKNDRGTIAMARTQVLDSATSQFFINVVNNDALNYPSNGGYAVFGKVVEGMDVVDAIAAVRTGTRKGMQDVPVEPVVIQSAEVLAAK